MATLDTFFNGVVTQDTRQRIQTHPNLVAHLSKSSSSLECEEMDKFVDGLSNWVSSSNFKISLNGLEILSLLADRLGDGFRPYVPSVLPACVDRLGDSKDAVRESSQGMILKLMNSAGSQYVFDRMTGAFTHKLWRVREQVCLILFNTLNQFGAKSLKISALVPSLCKLLEDSAIPVREAATKVLVEVYRHVGERVRSDIARKDISQSKMSQLFARMDEVRDANQMLASTDDVDFAKPTGMARVAKRGGSSTLPRKSSVSSAGSHGRSASSSGTAGAMDVDSFEAAYHDVNKVHLFSSKELAEHMTRIKDMLSDGNKPWEKRIEAIKDVRALVIAGAMEYDEFPQLLKTLEPSFQVAIKDLRSQVVREACITTSFLSSKLGNRLDHFAETVFPNLIQLIPNSAKVMSSSGSVCIQIILHNTFAPRLIPIIVSNITSKASIIRKETSSMLDTVLQCWPTHTLERHQAILQDAIKKGISDADQDTRANCRRAYWGFAAKYKEQADLLLNSLDPAKQRALQGELSRASSTKSLDNVGGTKIKVGSRARSVSTDRSRDIYSRQTLPTGPQRRPVTSMTRSVNSKIDQPARPKRTIAGTTDARSRPKSRIGMSQSQPGSRSSSPSSRLSYLTHTTNNSSNTQQPKTPGLPRRSGIPRSTGTSRETSPTRLFGRERRSSTSSVQSRYAQQPRRSSKPHKILSPNADAEAALAAALRSPRKRFDYESDDASETSSVCSERSFTSYSRTSDDMAEIMNNLGSGSWADRKEGLLALQSLLRGGRVLNRLELRKLMETFTRMFHDPHGKVFSLFLETIIDFVAVHRNDLHDWLYVLLTRLLNKLGGDVLGSVQAKVQRALEAVRDSFPYDHQFNTMTRFIIDQTQTPNLKVKVALLNYLHGLILMMDPSDFINNGDTRLAISRITTWTTEPKSVDVRKCAQSVLIALFNLNTPEFSLMLSALPKTFQDNATKILTNHLHRSGSDTEPLSPRNMSSPSIKPSPRYKPSSGRKMSDSYTESENMNPEDIYNSMQKTYTDIQNLNSGFNDDDHLPHNDKITLNMDPRSPTMDSPLHLGDTPDGKYNPNHYLDESNGLIKSGLAEATFDGGDESFNSAAIFDDQDEISGILSELSNHNARYNEREEAMMHLIRLVRDGNESVLDDQFKTILLLLLETLGDDNAQIRALSLRVLKEILQHQPDRFKDYSELTILKILEAHKDPVRQVMRAAENCAIALATSIPADQSIRVLKPIILTADFPVNSAAIKMQMKTVENIDKATLKSMLPDILPGLLKGFYNGESAVRKASVFCIVAVYVVMGEELRPHLSSLDHGKMKLLNLYIKRATQSDGTISSASTSKTTSPTPMQ